MFCMVFLTRGYATTEVKIGETGFPHSPTYGCPGRLQLSLGYGETGFPHTPPRGRVWEGCALLCRSRGGVGKPGFPTPCAVR